ncbi:MAG TPA: hypothetical protein VKI65_10210, partial [Gemmataceae bacterium]|nr:hypothetical protein [Gemmataceae bacterium]
MPLARSNKALLHLEQTGPDGTWRREQSNCIRWRSGSAAGKRQESNFMTKSFVTILFAPLLMAADYKAGVSRQI